MSAPGWLVAAVVIGLPLLLILEGKRQERRHGKGSGKGGALLRAGMLETQRLLEPERKVEIVQQKKDAIEQGGAPQAGDPPRR